jgi:maleate cis-trans isomerase
MPSVAVIDSLETDLGVPVVTSMQAMAWAALRAVNVRDEVTGYGRLWHVA